MAIDFYEFVEQCKAEGLTSYEAQTEYQIACEEEQERIIAEYENDPMTWEGWHQQDMIDMRYLER